ncbi:MAG: tetratricopeptide repeat-containing sensor histidine kinase [Flavobacterium sp.]|uniref:histidine kinase n=1 Tax=Myroides marinus TaxID=703342 RepID=A0A1H6Y8L5_9FLAO|nr:MULTISPECIES: tetratricopeptide repeat protein [Myroides]EKB03332.1 hypothetical protein HMPREF9711_02659 [Myroides odoratimimus CCUG 3837]MCS7474091.1 tetratricopeptide repeat protein [Myroides odoratimimus]MDM1395911.1 tetratricopeptide repeat protein [Myroides odoratimimus]MDM1401279.1 tetratricopeptide repeat protein [Myroides odoratimimus]MEC4035758.1 tetratricopeptide repeat protein [Myroides odoratimimus]
MNLSNRDSRVTLIFQLVIFFIFTKGIAQQPVRVTIDSLSKVYSQNVYSKPLEARKAAFAWLALSEKHNLEKEKARAYYSLGNLNSINGDYKKSIEYALKTIESLEKLKMEQGLPAAYNLLALSYKNLSLYSKAMESFMICIEKARAVDDVLQEANAYQNVATLYIQKDEYDKAIESLKRANDLYKSIEDTDGVLTTLFNYANILKEQRKFDQAREHYMTVLKFRQEEGNKTVEAYVKINLAQLLVEQHKFKEAIPHLENTYKLLEELNYVTDMAIVLNDLGVCESKVGNTKKAIKYFERALSITEERSILAYNTNFFLNLGSLYADQKQYEKAYNYLYRSIIDNTKFNSIEKEKHLADLQQQYETELKETKIELLEKEQELKEVELREVEQAVIRQKQLRNTFIIGFILVSILFIIVMYFYLQRLKVQRQLQVEVEKNANHKINEMVKDHKISMIERYQKGQEEERARLARELHDGIGSDLAGIKIAFEHHFSQQDTGEQTKRLQEAINNACKDLRLLSHQLHPLAFSSIGFSSFLKEYVDTVSQKNNLTIKAYFFPETEINKLTDDVLAGAYRIVQELVNNIVKHAKASSAEVQLTKHDDHLNILIHDNGVGFANVKKQGIGLRNIRERLEKLKGSIEIDSNVKYGTSITINIPLNK